MLYAQILLARSLFAEINLFFLQMFLIYVAPSDITSTFSIWLDYVSHFQPHAVTDE